MKLILLTSLLLVSPLVNAAAIKNIKVFQTNEIRVIHDVALTSNQQLEVFNMDTKNDATAKLNRLVQEYNATQKKTEDIFVSYSEAFDHVLNGSHWDDIYTNLETGSKAITFAMRYQVKKTPAIVINETSIIYGVTSIKEAMRIYNKKGYLK